MSSSLADLFPDVPGSPRLTIYARIIEESFQESAETGSTGAPESHVFLALGERCTSDEIYAILNYLERKKVIKRHKNHWVEYIGPRPRKETT